MEKIFAAVLSVLGILMGGISFIFNGYKSLFDLFGRIGLGGLLISLALIIFIQSVRESRQNRHRPDEDFIGRC